MPRLRRRTTPSALARRPAGAHRAAPSGGGLGGGTQGGPLYTDAFQAHRAPSRWELVEAYKSLIYFCATLNAGAVVRVPLRLYATTAPGQRPPRGRAVHAANARRRTRRTLDRMLRRGLHPAARSVAMAESVDEVADHPLLETLDRPGGGTPENEYFDRKMLLWLICLYLDVVGDAFLRPVAPAEGLAPTELWPLQSQYVYPRRQLGTALVESWRYFEDTWPYAGLIRFRWPGLRDPYGAGYGPAQAAIEYARLEDRFTAIQEQILGAGPRPQLLVSAKDPMNPPGKDERKRFEQDLERRHARGMAGRALVTDGSWDVTPITYPLADLGQIGVSEYDLTRTMNCFGVPPAYATTDTNMANLEASHRLHAERAVEPRCDLIAAVLTAYARRFEPRLFFAFDSCFAEDEESRAKVIDLYLKNGKRTINELRVEDCEEPVPWGDEPWFPSTLIQPSAAEEQRANAQALAEQGLKQQGEANKAKADQDRPAQGPPTDEGAKARAILDRAERLVRAVRREFDVHGDRLHDRVPHHLPDSGPGAGPGDVPPAGGDAPEPGPEPAVGVDEGGMVPIVPDVPPAGDAVPGRPEAGPDPDGLTDDAAPAGDPVVPGPDFGDPGGVVAGLADPGVDLGPGAGAGGLSE